MKIFLRFYLLFVLTASISFAQTVRVDQTVQGDEMNYLIDSPDTFYVGTTMGVFRSPDKGQSWNVVTENSINYSVRAMQMQERKLFVGTNGGGIYISSNAGQTWLAMNNGLLNKNILSVGNGSTFVLVGTTHGGIYILDNGVNDWKNANDGIPPQADVYTVSAVGGMLYAGTQVGIFSSPVGKIKWSLVEEKLR